jgi:flagellar basal body-associated protein FliL
VSESKPAWTPGRLILIVVLLLVLFALATLGMVHYLLAAKAGPAVSAEKAQPGLGPAYSLDTFNVNLADPDSRHFLKATVSLELGTQSLSRELEKRQAQVRDIIITLLREKKAGELKNGNAAVEELKREIRDRLNAVLTTGKVTAVYFTEFIVQ